ncbi:MAG TPA: helix-turn-helix transcriptional regulator [Kofleriaceae bacterium]|jgi:DNA-binding PadR family transcriptional regulator
MRNQFFMPGELPLVLLDLLSDRPQGGYELLGELGRRFGSAGYRPSPGSVYPALSALRAEQLVEQEPGGGGKASYRVTAQGRRMLSDQRGVLARIEARTSAGVKSDASWQPVLDRFVDRISKLSGRVDAAAVERILDNAAKAVADLEVSHEQ